eukprot:gnl/Chilomastix_caulleri/2702.p1 GENE.gnl/Chilomastix_caulleri/2702~~gnl/Chilomastix_caulleri/2702.p1  ORF type:complete len:174 (+),score=55.41 gnl/Chilomastix_caulleri/2702:144-665(+)
MPQHKHRHTDKRGKERGREKEREKEKEVKEERDTQEGSQEVEREKDKDKDNIKESVCDDEAPKETTRDTKGDDTTPHSSPLSLCVPAGSICPSLCWKKNQRLFYLYNVGVPPLGVKALGRSPVYEKVIVNDKIVPVLGSVRLIEGSVIIIGENLFLFRNAPKAIPRPQRHPTE